jgi:8-oxo-dGTP pyrophosphatase MutT (NUDIX family)
VAGAPQAEPSAQMLDAAASAAQNDAALAPSPLVSAIPGFDPRDVPVLGTDTHLPAIGLQQLASKALHRRFATQPVWTPEVLREPAFTSRPARAAAVLIAIVTHPEPSVLLTLRAAHLRSHSGQIAFPGGQVDAQDADAVAAALREAQEEIGLPPAQVRVLGSLPVYTTGSAFNVTPVVALVEPGVPLVADPAEVDAVFEVPLAFLMNPANHRRHRVQWQGAEREWFSMPYQDGAVERFIWGASAGMLRNLYRFLAA